MVLEDAHWIDPTTLELFDLVVERLERLPVLLVATYRPEFPPPWSGRRARDRAGTQPPRAGRRVIAIVDRLTAGRGLPGPLLGEIVAKADGVPLFVEELTKAVEESGLLDRRGTGISERTGLARPAFAVPSTLQDSLTAQNLWLAPVVARLLDALEGVEGFP